MVCFLSQLSVDVWSYVLSMLSSAGFGSSWRGGSNDPARDAKVSHLQPMIEESQQSCGAYTMEFQSRSLAYTVMSWKTTC